jgi:hypothetical protein
VQARRVRSDSDIGRHRQREPRTHGRAVDPGDDRLSVSNRNARRNRPTQPFSSSTCSWSDSPVSTDESSPPPRSRPEQNASPLPVNATTRTLSSVWASLTARTMLQPSEAVSAFFRCGRSSRNTLTCPTVSAASCDIAQGCHARRAHAVGSGAHGSPTTTERCANHPVSTRVALSRIRPGRRPPAGHRW